MAWHDSSESLLHRLSASSRPGRITRRQTTYWDVSISGPQAEDLRIHFRGKREAHFTTPSFSHCSLATTHPLLADYSEANASLAFHGPPTAPTRVLQALDELVARQSEGWRSLDHYLNPLIEPRKLLASGGGVLLEGPLSLVQAVKECLITFDIDATVLELQTPVRTAVTVLLLHPNFIVAEAFRVEPSARV